VNFSCTFLVTYVLYSYIKMKNCWSKCVKQCLYEVRGVGSNIYSWNHDLDFLSIL